MSNSKGKLQYGNGVVSVSKESIVEASKQHLNQLGSNPRASENLSELEAAVTSLQEALTIARGTSVEHEAPGCDLYEAATRVAQAIASFRKPAQ